MNFKVASGLVLSVAFSSWVFVAVGIAASWTGVSVSYFNFGQSLLGTPAIGSLAFSFVDAAIPFGIAMVGAFAVAGTIQLCWGRSRGRGQILAAALLGLPIFLYFLFSTPWDVVVNPIEILLRSIVFCLAPIPIVLLILEAGSRLTFLGSGR